MTEEEIAEAIAETLEAFTARWGNLTFLNNAERRADLQASLEAALANAASE